MYCPGGNATDALWRVLGSSDGISSWTPLKPQHSIPCWLSVQWEPSAYNHACAVLKRDHQNFVGGFTLSGLLGSGRASMLPLETLSLGLWVIAVDPAFISWHFLKFKTEFYCISFFWSSDCIFEIHQLWQSGFSRVYSNCCCSCSFEPEIIKIGLSSHKMYNSKILNFQESKTILNAYTKMSGNLLNVPRIYIYIYIYMGVCVCACVCLAIPLHKPGCDTRSIFYATFSRFVFRAFLFQVKLPYKSFKEPNLPPYLPVGGGRKFVWIPCRKLSEFEIQTALSRVSTQ